MNRLILIFIFFVFINMTSRAQDSISKKILTPKLIQELDYMFEQDQLYRNVVSSRKSILNTEQRKELWAAQTQIDRKNVKRLIEIVKEYGYITPSNSNLNKSPQVIFVHTPEEYIKEVTELIEKEYIKGSIDKVSYSFITWHLKGRKGVPFEFKYVKNDSIN